MSRTVSLLLRFSLIVVAGVCAIGLLGSQLLPQLGEMRHAASFEPASNIALPQLPEGSKILDMHGQPAGGLVGAENRRVVTLDQVSDQLIDTVLAVEDADFYRHDGVSAKSVLRAVRANSDAGGISQGGSTITQQLVKLSLVGSEKTLSRKVKEASLAIQLENQFCKDVEKVDCKNRILEQYLNLVYLGRGAYGVEAASQVYFGKPASEIGYGEAAVIASLIRNPNYYDPIRYPEVAAERREVVLLRMVEQELVTEDEAAMIAAGPLPTEAQTVASSASSRDLTYFERRIRDELLRAEWLAPTEELRRYLIFNGGLTITSTLDPRAQLLAAVASENNPIKQRNPSTIAVVASVEPATGAVRAVVGETTVEGKGLVEVALPAGGRSPGSSFKTFTLLAALEEGHSVRDSISAAPAPRSLYDDWELPSSTRSWPSGCKGGSLDLVRATASSNNCAFVRLQEAVGGDKVIEVAKKLGINTLENTEPVKSMTLGGGVDVRPLEMAAAYAAIANDGKYNPPHFVTKVEDRDGNVLFEYQPSTEQAISVNSARQATVALEAVVTGGTYKGGSLPGRRPAAGKTGTNEADGGINADVWFVGFTPEMSTAVWIGDPSCQCEMRGGKVQGGSTAAKVWNEFMSAYVEDLPVTDFKAPDSFGSRSSIPDPWKQYSSKSSSSSSSSKKSSSKKSSSGNRSSGSGTTATTAAPSTPDAGGSPSSGGGGDDDGGGGGGGGAGGGGGGGGGGGDD
ncbi:MAG: penicillin-binding protein [Actinomycetota bacterium]|nr:penicillin-binding protein [Actinomycetota bacterium]